jgi:Flp pilus assembly protein CpaB
MTKLKTPQLPPIVSSVLRQLNRYKVVLFLAIVAGVYGYILLQINSLSNAQPSAEQVSSQASPIKPAHIDKTVVAQLKRLQDNSVSVQALFDTARNNPFQE